MHPLFGKRTDLSKQDHSVVIERGRGVKFHIQNGDSDDPIPGEVGESYMHRLPSFLSLDGMAVFTALTCYSRADHASHHFIARHNLIDGQGSYFRIAEFDGIYCVQGMRFYALSNDRLGVVTVDTDTSQKIVNQYVIRIGHRPRFAEVTARRSFPIGDSRFYYFKTSPQLDNRIMLSDERHPILILAADIEAPESKKYCHCCRLGGYFPRLKNEARDRNICPPSYETLTLGRNGVYVGTGTFCVLGLEWQRNNKLPADLCHRRVEDTVPVFYRFDQQFIIHHCNLLNKKRDTLDVFVIDLTRLVQGDAHPEMRCTQFTISALKNETFRYDHLNLMPDTSSVVVELGHPSNLLRLRSAFDVPPLRQLVFEAVYKYMKPEERSKPGWMQTLCGFECV